MIINLNYDGSLTADLDSLTKTELLDYIIHNQASVQDSETGKEYWTSLIGMELLLTEKKEVK